MPTEIDGFAVLGAIARSPGVFPAVRTEVAKTAKGFVGKQMKSKTLTAAELQAIADAVTWEAFELIADGMSDAEIKALLAKVDKLNGAIRSMSGTEQRKHLADLARGVVAPSEKSAAKPAKAPAPARPKVERSGNVKAMRARKQV